MTTPESKKSEGKPWWLLAIAILAVGGIIAAAVAMTADEDNSGTAGGPSPGSIGDPEIRQARWRITSDRAPGKRITKRQRTLLRKQKKNLNRMTREIFDSMFLSPELKRETLRNYFRADARKSYQRAGAGLPGGADDVRVRRRWARIVIDANSRATISVRILARGQAANGTFATEHRSALYASRSKKGWKVFGFVMDQKPFKKKAKASPKDDRNDKNKKRSKKTNKNSGGKKSKERSGGKNRRGDR